MNENESNKNNSNEPTLRNLVKQLQQVKQSLTTLYINKSKIEKEILNLVDEELINIKETHNLDALENFTFELEDLVEIGLLYKKKLNHEKLKELHPDVYMWGRKIVFDYNTALLSFRDKRKFWKVIAECTETKETIDIKPIERKRHAKKRT